MPKSKTVTIPIPEDVILHGAVEFFCKMLQAGQSPSMAEIFALQSAPNVKSMTSFCAHRGTLESQFEGDDYSLNRLVAMARSEGYNPNPNDIYIDGLADHPGDKDAFVPPADAESHIRKKLAKRGMSLNASTGEVTVNSRPDPPPRPVAMAPDLVRRNARKMIVEDPSLSRLHPKDLKAEAIHRHGPQK
jgi:hypothetical protein